MKSKVKELELSYSTLEADHVKATKNLADQLEQKTEEKVEDQKDIEKPIITNFEKPIEESFDIFMNDNLDTDSNENNEDLTESLEDQPKEVIENLDNVSFEPPKFSLSGFFEKTFDDPENENI